VTLYGYPRETPAPDDAPSPDEASAPPPTPVPDGYADAYVQQFGEPAPRGYRGTRRAHDPDEPFAPVPQPRPPSDAPMSADAFGSQPSGPHWSDPAWPSSEPSYADASPLHSGPGLSQPDAGLPPAGSSDTGLAGDGGGLWPSEPEYSPLAYSSAAYTPEPAPTYEPPAYQPVDYEPPAAAPLDGYLSQRFGPNGIGLDNNQTFNGFAVGGRLLNGATPDDAPGRDYAAPAAADEWRGAMGQPPADLTFGGRAADVASEPPFGTPVTPVPTGESRWADLQPGWTDTARTAEQTHTLEPLEPLRPAELPAEPTWAEPAQPQRAGTQWGQPRWPEPQRTEIHRPPAAPQPSAGPAAEPAPVSAKAGESWKELVIPGEEENDIPPWDSKPLMIAIASAVILVLIGIAAGFVTSHVFDPGPKVATWRPAGSTTTAGSTPPK
jgi:hypothetical protein